MQKPQRPLNEVGQDSEADAGRRGMLKVASELGVGGRDRPEGQARDGCCLVKERALEAARRQMAGFDARVLPIVIELRDKAMSFNAIARILTARHIATLRGGTWTPTGVCILIARASALRLGARI
jgi:hypothetical protein